ncbi:MAG: TonB-dependent receptor [Coraliomargaritaceae bacterium]
MNKYKLTYLVLAAASSAVYTNLKAQENDVVELEDYEVVGKYLQADQITSLKTPTPIEDIPKSVTILTSDLIGLQDLTSMAGIADYVPGIIAGQGEGHRDDILFRGQKSTADFFVDGVRDDVQYYRPLYNVEQVEVLKGADALFFGRGGTGGLINRVSKKALIGEDFRGYTLSFDDLGEKSLQIDSNMTIAPNAALRLNYYTEDLENNRDHYYGDNSGINPTLTYKLNENTTVNVSYENLDQERFIDRGIPTDSNDSPDASLANITFGDADYNKSTVDADIIKLSVDHKLDSSSKLRLNYTESDFSKMYQNYYPNSAYNQVEDGYNMKGYHDETERGSKTLSIDLIGEKEFNGLSHKYVLGFETIDTANKNMRDKSSSNTYVNPSQFNALAEIDSNDSLNDRTRAQLDVTSIYFSDEIALTDKLDLVLGGRLDKFELDVKDDTDDNKSGGDQNRKDEEFSPRLGFVYKPQNNVTYYASYSETFLPKSGGQYADLNPDYKGLDRDKTDPDVFESTEFGVKFDLDNGISVTAAKYELKDISPKVSSTGSYTISETTVDGYEFQAIGNISQDWFMSAGASFVNNADSILEVPEKTFSIWNLYKVDSKLSLGLGIVYKGDTIGKGNDAKLPAYTRIDAAAYYKIDDNMRVQLNLENLADKLYYPHNYDDHQVSVGAPFHATLKLVGRF